MAKFNNSEYHEISWIVDNTSEMVFDEARRAYFLSAKSKELYRYNVDYTDNELLALIQAIDHHIEMYECFLKLYPKGHSSISGVSEKVSVLKSGRKTLMMALSTEKEKRKRKKACLKN